VDSPMANAATRITLKYVKLPELEHVHFTESTQDSMAINAVRAGAAIISASGMCEGGRIKHHLRHNISRPECAILFTGFQAAGTLGRRIVDGAPAVRIFGEEYAVRARVFTIGGLSAHADQSALLGWLGGFRKPPRQCFVVHGEPPASDALRGEIGRRLGWNAVSPVAGQSVSLA
jgi:metallo-beta-lactamase family protein